MHSAMLHLARAATAAALVSLLLATAAVAGPIADNAGKAEQDLATGDAAGAIAAFDEAADAFWSAVPLTFRVATFATDVKGFGEYTPVSDATFHAGDTATIYLEPVGYGFAPVQGDNAGTPPGFRVSYTTGIEIRTPGGLILGKTDNLGTAEWSGTAKSYQVQTAVSVALPAALKPGSYLLLLTLTDTTTRKSATATLPFAIAE